MDLHAKDEALKAFDDDFDNLRDDQDLLLNDLEDQDIAGNEPQIAIVDFDEDQNWNIQNSDREEVKQLKSSHVERSVNFEEDDSRGQVAHRSQNKSNEMYGLKGMNATSKAQSSGIGGGIGMGSKIGGGAFQSKIGKTSSEA